MAATRWCAAPLVPLHERPGGPRQGALAWRAYARVLEQRGDWLRVAPVLRPEDAEPAAPPVWARAEAFQPLVRPPRPSRAEEQMARLLTVARQRAGEPRRRCYDALKDAIFAAGGYGDLLDLRCDERFQHGPRGPTYRYQAAAWSFARAIEDAGGPAACGLVRLDRPPWEAPPGAILVLRGNGHPSCPVDPDVGDISVVAGLQGGTPDRPEFKVRSGGAVVRGPDLAPQPDAPRLAPGTRLTALRREKLPGRPLCCLVAPAEEPDRERTGEALGWVAREELRDVPRALIAYNDGRAELAVRPAAWRSAALRGVVVGVFQPSDRSV